VDKSTKCLAPLQKRARTKSKPETIFCLRPLDFIKPESPYACGACRFATVWQGEKAKSKLTDVFSFDFEKRKKRGKRGIV
jgi:hypothetical protein